MIRYRLRTLLILLAVLPPVLAGVWLLDLAWPIAMLAAIFVPWGVATGVLAFLFDLVIAAKLSQDRRGPNH